MRRIVSQEALKRLYEDKEMLNEVKNYLFAYLDSLGLDKIYKRMDTAGVADARQALDNAFDQLDDLFAPAEDNKKEPINEAR